MPKSTIPAPGMKGTKAPELINRYEPLGLWTLAFSTDYCYTKVRVCFVDRGIFPIFRSIEMSKVAMSPRGPIVAERKVRILIVDDHPIFRQGIRQLLEQERDFSVVAEAADGEEAIKLVTELSPDIVLMDMGMPKLNGLEATRQIKKEYPNIMVLALTVHVEDEYIFSILGAGAEGYLLKTTQNSELVQAIRSVLSGNFVFAPCVVRRLLKHAATYPVKPIRVSYGQSITPREIEVLKL